MKLSQITAERAFHFARAENQEELALFEEVLLPAASAYLQDYTGLTVEDLEGMPDAALACLVLCSFLYDNRSMVVENSRVNRVLESCLDAHRRNLL